MGEVSGGFGVERLGEDAVLLRLGRGIDPGINARVHDLVARLEAVQPRGVREWAGAYDSVLVRLERAVCLDAAGFEFCLKSLRELLDESLQADLSQVALREASVLTVPVAYGGSFGPDLEAVARHAGLEPEAVIGLHAGVEYPVAMLGFAPGFAYLLGLDACLEMPRRANPRLRVPPGSVAIGGTQTGIYPARLPGGWNLIGRTPLRLFDPEREPAALLRPGQRVRFRAIDAHEFSRLRGPE